MPRTSKDPRLVNHFFLPFAVIIIIIDPIVYSVHACGAALHEPKVHMERSMGLKQRTPLYRDGECVCVCARV